MAVDTSDDSIKKVLQKHYNDSVFHTHVSMIQPRGKFQFNRGDLETLWDVYCESVKSEKKPIVGIAEKPQRYMPVLVDIDIKIMDNEGTDWGEHIYDDTHIIQTIETYQSILRNILDDCSDEDLTCVLLEKPIYKITKGKNTYSKNGFHLHFPYIFMDRVDQETHLIPRAQKMLSDIGTFVDLGFEDSGSVIDRGSCSVPWLLYGSRKDESMEPYVVTKVFDSECSVISLEEAFSKYRLYDKDENLIEIKGNVEKYLPRILSVFAYGRETKELKTGLVSPLKEKIMSKAPKKKIQVSVKEALKLSAKLLPLLGQFRAEDRNEWMTVGWALFNIGDGCPEALEQWLEFSARDEEGYDESACIYEWERMTKRDITMGTLRYFASIDSPEQYTEFTKEQAKHHMEEAIQGSHNDIAKALYEMYGNKFVCASYTSKIWYQYTDHRWEEIEEGVFLRTKISDELAPKYVKMGQDLYKLMSECTDKPQEAAYRERQKLVTRMIANLKSSPFKNNVMKECCEIFYDRRFRDKLDLNKYLIAFKNGVYDLKLNIFRDGRPEDFLSKSMGIEYKEFDEDDDDIRFVIDYLQKMFPDKSVRQYFLDNSSDVFVGGNKQKIVLFWTGHGDNGKSMLQTIFEQMFGELAIKFNTTLLTGEKVGNGSANPELARAGNGVRWTVLEEPNRKEIIKNDGLLKSLSGNDKYLARDLFEKGKNTREIKPMFKVTFICNQLSKMSGDAALWNRVRVLPFESTFVKAGQPCPETFEEQLRQKRFPRDPDFEDKIPGMLQAFCWLLLEHRKNITSRIEPEKVMEATRLYQRKNDIYRQFIEECIVDAKPTEEGHVSAISLIELYARFKEWHKESFPGHTLPIKDDISEYFEKAWGNSDKGRKWHGYRFRTLKDDIDEGEVIVMEYDTETESVVQAPV